MKWMRKIKQIYYCYEMVEKNNMYDIVVREVMK